MIKIELDLDKIWLDSDWDTTIGSILRDELKLAIRNEVRRDIKNDPQLKKVVGLFRKKAIMQAIEAIK